MADKAISELIAAEQITATDMFVLEQNGAAKMLTGQILLNWLTKAADGHGGIQSIVPVGTTGLADTYRITLADTTTFDFVVTNGEKGDPGDTAYIWIKFASQEPTEESHSFGDIPDDWIGIYSGFSETAPEDWKRYRWFEIKGKQGNVGDPAVLVSTEVAYQASASGTVVPSGAWSDDIPVVAQGRYLWTRVVQTFNSGDPVTVYSVSRMGVDGLGSVVSVNHVSPDSEGNVKLTPGDVGVVSNLLRNSDFRNPINQRGLTDYVGNGYTIDGWRVRFADFETVLNDGYISLSYSGLPNYAGWYQVVTPGIITAGTTYTMAVGLADGSVHSAAIEAESVNGASGLHPVSDLGYLELPLTSEGYRFAIDVFPEKTMDVVWAALYEGEYTAETLPEYRPKERILELMNSLVYFHLYATGEARPANGLDCSPPMRIDAVTQGSLEIDGVTYYYNSAEL